MARDGSPLSPYVDPDPMNGMTDFPAMEMVVCRWEEAEKGGVLGSWVNEEKERRGDEFKGKRGSKWCQTF